MLTFNLVVGFVFAVIGGVMAFMITYEEYAKKFVDRKKPVKIALKMAVATFAFFMALSLLLGLLFPRLF